jgi:hypothetical protein
VFCQRLRKELEQQTTAVCAERAATAKHPVRRFVFNGEEEGVAILRDDSVWQNVFSDFYSGDIASCWGVW